MFQFTSTTVINSNLDSNGVAAKFGGSASAFYVTRAGTFKKDNIVSVHKRPYEAGVKEQGTITVPTIEAGRVARLVIDVRLSQSVDSEYANTHLYFSKPVTMEIIASGTASTDAAELAKQINKLRDRFGHSYVTATVAGAVITISATTNHQRLFSMKVEKEIVPLFQNTVIQPAYEVVATGTVTVKGKNGFGDDEYMIKSIMVPTNENTRYFGMNKEERPIIGGNYSEFVIRYSIDRDGDDGMISGLKSVTTHVFYVKSDLVATFEAALEATFPAIKTLGSAGTLLINGDELLDLSNGEVTTLTALNATGAVTWVSGTPATATIVSGTGAVTPVAAGTTVITATDSVGATGTFTITVVA